MDISPGGSVEALSGICVILLCVSTVCVGDVSVVFRRQSGAVWRWRRARGVDPLEPLIAYSDQRLLQYLKVDNLWSRQVCVRVSAGVRVCQRVSASARVSVHVCERVTACVRVSVYK